VKSERISLSLFFLNASQNSVFPDWFYSYLTPEAVKKSDFRIGIIPAREDGRIGEALGRNLQN